MLVKGIFTNISGSLGGMTGSRNKGGQYLRARTNPTQPNTLPQQNARQRFGAASAAWGNLAPEIRALWNNYASLQSWTNRLGDPIQLTGQQAYVGSNSALASVGLAQITNPPEPNDRPESYVPNDLVYNTLDTFVGGASPGLDAADRVSYAISPILPSGVTSYKGRYVIIAVGAGNVAPQSVTGINAAAEAYLGPVTQGQQFWMRTRVVQPDGTYSPYTFKQIPVFLGV